MKYTFSTPFGEFTIKASDESEATRLICERYGLCEDEVSLISVE